MHDNPQTPPPPLPAALEHRVITMTGRDSSAFAQAQFMNDVDAIAPGHWQWNGWLTPKGRVIALFALLKLDAETLWLLLPDADPSNVADGLRRFVFRSKVAMAVRDDLLVTGCFGACAGVQGNAFAIDSEGALELDMGGDGGPRCLRIATGAACSAEADAVARWAACDLEHGLPRLPNSQIEQWTPQQLTLDRLHGFSVKKGCYPGQEIVARTHFLGKVKRGVVLLESDAPLSAGADVHASGTAIGKVVAIASDGDRHLGLAVLPLERDSPVSDAGGVPVREASIEDGLAR